MNLAAPFLPLAGLSGDEELAALFSENALIESWLKVERALAIVQAEVGLIPATAATSIVAEAVATKIDRKVLRADTRTVGYPILPLLEQISHKSPADVADFIHWGATTQDIMDTALSLQVALALTRMEQLVVSLGDALAGLADKNRSIPMAGRTHAQIAVPITFGYKAAIWLDELQRHLARLRALRPRVQMVQLFGAAGTAAALGPASREVRRRLAKRLELEVTDVPWHTARDGIAELGFVLAALAATSGKIAREIIELSRSEIGEVRESNGHHRGASSTMPQKANPILSEAVLAMSILARHQVPALLAAMQGGHERSAGEWQVEWDALPTLFSLTGGCLRAMVELIEGLKIFPERMRDNLWVEGGVVMAEAVMIALAPSVGRLRAHALVAEACRESARTSVPLVEVLPTALGEDLLAVLPPLEELFVPERYLGETDGIVSIALEQWTCLGAEAERG